MKKIDLQLNNCNVCDICGSEKFQIPKESILFTQYPFFSQENIKMCAKCGNLYFSCPKCNIILFLISVPINSFKLIAECSQCGEKFPKIVDWVQERSEEFQE